MRSFGSWGGGRPDDKSSELLAFPKQLAFFAFIFVALQLQELWHKIKGQV